MAQLLKKIPLPIVGLMLGLAGMGNLIQGYGSQYRYLAGALSLVVALLIIGRIIIDQKAVLTELDNPVVASVAPAFSMAVIILASYLVNFSFQLALAIWYIGIVLHLSAIILFSLRYLRKFSIRKVFPSYFIVYVGIVVASVTAPVFERLLLGQIIFWFGFIGYMIFLPIVAYRVLIIGEIKRGLLPIISIFTAPAGLCLAGYMSTFPEKNLLFLAWLIFLTLSMIIPLIIYLPKMLAVDFNPSFSAFTFPYIITAMGLKLSAHFLEQEVGYSWINYPALLIELLSVVLVLYVFYKYSIYLLANNHQLKKRATAQR